MNKSTAELGKISLGGENRCSGERIRCDKIATCSLILELKKIDKN